MAWQSDNARYEGLMSDTDPPTLPDDETLLRAGWVRISRRARRILSRPRVGQAYWVDFPHDAYEPEFVDEHPGIVVRAARSLHDTCIVVPLTTRPQGDERHVHRLGVNPNPVSSANGVVSFAICDHLYTINICRLRPILDRKGQPIYPRVSPDDLKAIFVRIGSVMPEIANPATGEPVPSGPSLASPPPRAKGPNTLSLPASRKDPS